MSWKGQPVKYGKKDSTKNIRDSTFQQHLPNAAHCCIFRWLLNLWPYKWQGRVSSASGESAWIQLPKLGPRDTIQKWFSGAPTRIMAPQVRGKKQQARARERLIYVLVYKLGLHAETAFVKLCEVCIWIQLQAETARPTDYSRDIKWWDRPAGVSCLATSVDISAISMSFTYFYTTFLFSYSVYFSR